LAIAVAPRPPRAWRSLRDGAEGAKTSIKWALFRLSVEDVISRKRFQKASVFSGPKVVDSVRISEPPFRQRKSGQLPDAFVSGSCSRSMTRRKSRPGSEG